MRLEKMGKVSRHGLEIVVTRIRSCSAAILNTSGSASPCSLASAAERRSIVGSLRKQPPMIPSLRSASARKRIIRSAFSGQQLLPCLLQVLFQVGRKRMSFVELIFLALALVDVVFNLCFAAQVESDRAVNLLQIERRVMRSNRLRGFSKLEFPYKVGQWHTTSGQIEAPVPAFNEFLHRSPFILLAYRNTRAKFYRSGFQINCSSRLSTP